MSTKKVSNIWIIILVFIFVIFFWELSIRILNKNGILDLISVSKKIYDDFIILVVSGGVTLVRALTGLIIASITGYIIGFSMVLFPTADNSLSPIVNLFRPIPSATLVFLWAVLITAGTSLIPTVVFGCIWPIILNIRDRGDIIEKDIKNFISIQNISIFRKYKLIYSRLLLPGFLDGLNISVSISLILTITVEMLIAPSFLESIHLRKFYSYDPPIGIGEYINFNYQNDHTGVLAGVLIAGILGYIINTTYHVIQLRVLKWQKLK